MDHLLRGTGHAPSPSARPWRGRHPLGIVVRAALLYYWTPNVRQPKFRWISPGAVIAIVIAVVASLGLSLYVANFGNFRGTYGALAGVIIFLFWLWITNLALLFGAEVDAELERGRQLQAGIRADVNIQLPARDDQNIGKKEQREEDLVEGARSLRTSQGAADTAADAAPPAD
ncbi:MAG: YihY/virulence factor BrkB family protein [Actinomycetota bacterium]